MSSADDTTTSLGYEDSDDDQTLILDGRERLKYFTELQNRPGARLSPLRKTRTGLIARLLNILR